MNMHYTVRKIFTFILGAAALSKKVMEDLSSGGRRLLVEESSTLVLSSLKRESDGGHGQLLSERECSWRALHKWLSQIH